MKSSVAALFLITAACAGFGRPDTPALIPEKQPEVPVTAVDLGAEKGQNSPSIAVYPADPRFMALASRVDGPTFSCDLHVSGDAGKTWVPAKPVRKLPEGAEKCYAPEVAIDSKGALHYLFAGLHTRGNTPMGVFLTTSRDRGRSFAPPRRVLGPSRYMVRMAVRTTASSGRIHLVWLEPSVEPPIGGLPPADNRILAAYSDDGGVTFSDPVSVSDPQRERLVAPALSLGPDGAVHVALFDLEDDARDYQGLPGPVWDGNWSLVLASSFDGGRSFAQHTLIDDELLPPERVMLILTMPPPAIAVDPSSGNIYVAWWDMRSGDWDVYLSRSGNRGKSFSRPYRVNDDRPKNGRHQYLPKISVAANGRLDAIFYDRRDDRENKDNHVYYAFSTDDGNKFARNLRLTSQSSNTRTGARYPIPSAEGLVEFGSRLGLHSGPSSVVAAWTDTRLPPPGYVNQNIFATRVTLSPVSQPINVPPALLLTGSGVLGALLMLVRRRPRKIGPRPDTAP